jgi:hypothetical protein
MQDTPIISPDDNLRAVEVIEEIAFTLALNKAVYTLDPTKSSPPQMTARLIFCSTVLPPVVLEFFSFQRFDLQIINDAGEQVYLWSAGQFFPLIAQNIPVIGEVHWTVDVPLADTKGVPLPTGQYIAQAYLVLHTDAGTRNPTAFARKYAASVRFMIQSTGSSEQVNTPH